MLHSRDSFYCRSCCYSFIFGPSLGYRPKLVSSEKEQALTIQHTAEPLNDGEATVKQKIRRMDLMEMRQDRSAEYFKNLVLKFLALAWFFDIKSITHLEIKKY